MRDPIMLAAALMSYEADEPHGDSEDSCYYPEITTDEVREWLASEHDGDCVSQPQPCNRCFAEAAMHKAEWLIAAIFSVRKDGE